MLEILVVMSAASALIFSVVFPRTFARASEHHTFSAALSRGSDVYSREQSFAALRAALSTNCNLLGGAEFYGPSLDINSPTLLHAYFIRSTQDLDQTILNIKGPLHLGLIFNDSSNFLRQSVEGCVEVLGKKKKDDSLAC